ncbi:serine carboxypeptidase [Trifolium repens]|nr:serine carboxypeptidase [Trifolium repens]
MVPCYTRKTTRQILFQNDGSNDFDFPTRRPVVYASLHGHAHYPHGRLNLLGKSGVGARDDTDKSNNVMDMGKFVLVSADYLGSEVQEPVWLYFFREWGPHIDYKLDDDLKGLEKFLPGKLKDLFEKIIRSLPKEMLGEEGPTVPKEKVEDNLIFLLKWFERFPQYKETDFFISGESYAGHYVPQLSQVIVKHNSATKQNSINLKGYMVGNAVTDDFNDQLGIFQFMWSSGMISDQTFKLFNLLCDFQSIEHPSKSCEKILEIADNELGNIDPYSVFTPPSHGSANQRVKRTHSVGRLRNHKPAKWETCSDVVGINWKDSPRTVLDIYRELIPTGLRIWIFSGNTDAVIPVTSTRYTIAALKLPTVSPWRAWYDDGEVGGWTQEYDGLTFVNVRGAGHEVPLHRPKLALTLFKAFLAGTSMPTLEPLSLTAAY